jgi:SpoVK/Ycf46/Vps4 family AAA+-type ATPase
MMSKINSLIFVAEKIGIPDPKLHIDLHGVPSLISEFTLKYFSKGIDARVFVSRDPEFSNISFRECLQDVRDLTKEYQKEKV